MSLNVIMLMCNFLPQSSDLLTHGGLGIHQRIYKVSWFEFVWWSLLILPNPKID